MPRYAALLRGINVGGKKKVAMADLRDLLGGLGYRDVETLLQSGNAVFAASGSAPRQIEERIEKAVRQTFSMDVRCLVREGDELGAVIAGNPLADVATNGSRFMALFLSAAPDPARLAAHDPRELAPAEIRLGDRVIYQWCPDGILAAPAAGPFVERHWKVDVTARNWNTVTKLSARLNG